MPSLARADAANRGWYQHEKHQEGKRGAAKRKPQNQFIIGYA